MIRFILIAICSTFFACHLSLAEPTTRKIGLVASLSGFAAPYGVAVKEGVELAISELDGAGERIELVVQDDQSDPTKVLSAYRFLKDIEKIELLVGGSWWVRPLAQITERDGIPLLSCETMQDADLVPSATYFVLSGRVADWVRVYEPLFREHSMHRAAVVRFTSGFSQSILDEMRHLFSHSGRELVGVFEYQDLRLSEAQSIGLRLKHIRPDVTFVDGQPEGLANFLRRREEMRMQDLPIVGHSAIEAAIEEGLVKAQHMRNVYFLRRRPPHPEFGKRFKEKFGRAPVLSADLGYAALHMAVAALESHDPLTTLRKGMTIAGIKLELDAQQVADGIPQEIHRMREDGEIVRVQ